MRTITANTFTSLYDNIEDRLRLVINYQDIENRVDFMITRAFAINLIPAAEEFIDNYYKDEIYPENNLTVSSQDNTNNLVSKTDNVNLEFLRTTEELLLELNFSFNKETKQTVLTFKSKNILVGSTFDAQTISQTFKIIKSSIPFIGWGISHNF